MEQVYRLENTLRETRLSPHEYGCRSMHKSSNVVRRSISPETRVTRRSRSASRVRFELNQLVYPVESVEKGDSTGMEQSTMTSQSSGDFRRRKRLVTVYKLKRDHVTRGRTSNTFRRHHQQSHTTIIESASSSFSSKSNSDCSPCFRRRISKILQRPRRAASSFACFVRTNMKTVKRCWVCFTKFFV